jgi:glycosyltransferase involved in cell wall biosynthesis
MRLDVSVVLPVFWRKRLPHHASELRRALDSVLQQTYAGALEVLVIDDGSVEPVADAFAGTAYHSDPRIRWLRLPRNGGLVNALNVGIASASHELIARLDADDAWRPTKMEKQLRLLAADPDLSLVATGMRLVHSSGEPDVDLVRPGDWRGILRFFVTEGCPFPHGSVVARRSAYLLLGGYSHDPRLSHCEDYALWGIWLRFFKPAMIEEVLYDYTVSPTSVSNVNREQQRQASGHVQRTFLGLGDTSRFPAALLAVAAELDVSLFEAGRFCYRLWKYAQPTVVPEAAVDHLRCLLPDRRIVISRAPAAVTSGASGGGSFGRVHPVKTRLVELL